ncbi:Pyruvate/2-oxoglutarate dehydrogenase complex, dihydrolipoamide acyltransferase (E2) component [Fimbriiglobus ruber]|uniref:Pyruvate/2-oxoglutarate dehydrogenase complex, dihydrolipoamide acyltransferase (E2) component n=1 Tax=Fimbriiglobus ruber TaxID=1908690 RepID=A0A225DYY8_9BACT|nr:Pyruvate/2-oxoglutarate dehydrogenase complex, dihydrolipoamide acyltransferase (E2) component [Fimbriiglobus ruber]
MSAPRRFIEDMLHFAAEIPTVPVQRRMVLRDVAAARVRCPDRPGWPAVFLKAFARVAADMPVLRRAYVKLPWPHLVEYPTSVASIAVEREYEGEPAVFFGRVWNPAKLPLAEVHSRIREFAEDPIEDISSFRKLLSFARLPRPLRRLGMWLGLNISRTRPGQFGTFGLTAYSSLGATSLHPLSPLSVTLTYGVVGADGAVDVRIIYDHRVMDGATVARALARLEDELTGPILYELRGEVDESENEIHQLAERAVA